MPKCILTLGVSGCGKSTWASQQGFYVLNRDECREVVLMLEDMQSVKENLWAVYNFKKHEKHTQEIWDMRFDHVVAHQQDFIISDTNLNPKYRIPLIKRLEDAGYTVEIKTFDTTFEQCVKNDLNRKNSVGKDIIYKQWQQWNQYLIDTGVRKRYTPNSSKPPAYLFDLDGTLFHMEDRGPYEWDKVGTDAVDNCVKEVLRGLWNNNNKILLVSGRDSACRDETAGSLYRNGIPYDYLFMRSSGDCRRDSIVKEEIFWKRIADNYNVKAVFDDRNQVIRECWEAIGIKVFKLGGIGDEF
jgi:predicted kinase